MLSKCIGIISYLPNDEQVRINRKNKFKKLLKVLDDNFKLPIVIVAQNWRDEDFDINYGLPIKIYKYAGALGVTGARIALREKLLLEDYDYFIFLDDDSNVVCTPSAAKDYLSQLDSHPGMFGLFNGTSWHRFIAISKPMLELMNYDFIKNYESCRGEIWEDIAYTHTYKAIYPNKWFNIKVNGLKEIQIDSAKDKDSTWYVSNPEFSNKQMQIKTYKIRDAWIKSLK